MQSQQNSIFLLTSRRPPVTVASSSIRGPECGPSSEGCPLIAVIHDHPYDLSKSLSKLKRQLDNANYRKKLKVSQRRTSRLKRKVDSLSSTVAFLKEKRLVSSACADVLETIFASAPRDLMKSIVSQRANNNPGAYTAE